jgi:hypothetical protein
MSGIAKVLANLGYTQADDLVVKVAGIEVRPPA